MQMRLCQALTKQVAEGVVGVAVIRQIPQIHVEAATVGMQMIIRKHRQTLGQMLLGNESLHRLCI